MGVVCVCMTLHSILSIINRSPHLVPHLLLLHNPVLLLPLLFRRQPHQHPLSTPHSTLSLWVPLLSCAHIHSIDHPLVYCSLVKFNLQKGALLHQVIHSGKKFGPILLTGWEKGSGKWYYSSCSRGASCTRYFSEVELANPNVTETAVYWTPYTAQSTDSAQCAQGVFCRTLVFVWFYCKLAVSYSKRFEHYNEPTLLWYSLCLEYCMENNQRAVKPGSSLILKAMRWGSDSMLYFWFVNISFTCSQATKSHL